MSVENPSPDTTDAGRAVDDFIGELDFGNLEDPLEKNKIEFKRLMEAIDFEDRWVYKGSYTEPPCNEGVYWNVIRTVYPVSNNSLEAIKQKMVMLSAKNDPDNHTYNAADFAGVDEETEQRDKTPDLKMYRKL